MEKSGKISEEEATKNIINLVILLMVIFGNSVEMDLRENYDSQTCEKAFIWKWFVFKLRCE